MIIEKPGMGQFHTQGVVDDVADGGAVAGAGEAVREAPVLQGIRNGPTSRLDIVKNFDRPCQPSAKSHGCPSPSSFSALR